MFLCVCVCSSGGSRSPDARVAISRSSSQRCSSVLAMNQRSAASPCKLRPGPIRHRVGCRPQLPCPAMAAFMAVQSSAFPRSATSPPHRRARRRSTAAPPWQPGARRRSPPRRQTSPPSGTGQPPSDPTLTPIPDLLAPPLHAQACLCGAPPRAQPKAGPLFLRQSSESVRSVRIRSTTLIRLLHGLDLLPSEISGTGNAMI